MWSDFTVTFVYENYGYDFSVQFIKLNCTFVTLACTQLEDKKILSM